MRLALSTLFCLLSVVVFAQPGERWYGPATATFWVQFPGNPYDFATNDVRVAFISRSGQRLERLAYYDGGAWRSHLVAPVAGHYRAVLYRNGIESLEPNEEGEVEVSEALPHGYLRADSAAPNRFAYSDGSRYWPIGFNLAWQSEGVIFFPEQLQKMGKAGLNWTRIWACHWDGKNPWWPVDDPYALGGQLSPRAVDTWQRWVDACAANGISFQMVLFHHGAFSTTVDSNWAQHPWNKANGGFLEKPEEFFTNEEAQKRTRMWIRYAVARWGHLPNLFAWELFNEVEWTDAARNGHWQAVVEWHDQIAAYLRELDPHKHLITTSSSLEQAAMWESMDFLQPHRHGSDVASYIAATGSPTKPLFLGEFGNEKAADQRALVREAIWASLLAGHAGAAQFWYWDVVEKQNLYAEFRAWAAVARESRFAEHPRARKITVFTGDERVEALGEVDWFLGRVPDGVAEVRSSGLASGTYKLSYVSLASGEVTTSQVEITDFRLPLPSRPTGEIVVSAVRRG